MFSIICRNAVFLPPWLSVLYIRIHVYLRTAEWMTHSCFPKGHSHNRRRTAECSLHFPGLHVQSRSIMANWGLPVKDWVSNVDGSIYANKIESSVRASIRKVFDKENFPSFMLHVCVSLYLSPCSNIRENSSLYFYMSKLIFKLQLHLPPPSNIIVFHLSLLSETLTTSDWPSLCSVTSQTLRFLNL